MNYDQTITDLITYLGMDKAIPQPYRNAVASSARRLQLEIRGALTMSNLQPPEGAIPAALPPMQCTCPAYPDMVDRSCPVHGK